MRATPAVLPKFNLVMIKIMDRVHSASELKRAELKAKGITLETGVSFEAATDAYRVQKHIFQPWLEVKQKL